MKKVKVTRRPQSHQDFTLRPSRVRIAAVYAFFFAIAVMLGMLIRVIAYRENANLSGLAEDWLTNLAIVMGGAVLFALLDYSRWTMRVLGGEKLEGPSGALGARSQIALDEIDWQRSGKSLRSRLKVGNAIYSLGRQRILISPWFYEPALFTEFLELIGYSPEN